MRPPAALPAFETPRPRRFFVVTAGAILVFTVFAFAQKLLAEPDRAGRYAVPWVLAHGAAMMAWLALFLAQPALLRAGRTGLHRALGLASPLVVAAVLGTGFTVSRAFAARSGMIEVFLSNMVQLGLFAACWAAGVAAALAGRTEAHPRLMLIATLATLSPPISRITQTLGLPNGLAAAANVAVVMALPLAFDIAVRSRPHPATLTAIAFCWLLIAAAAAAGLVEPFAGMLAAYVAAAPSL